MTQEAPGRFFHIRGVVVWSRDGLAPPGSGRRWAACCRTIESSARPLGAILALLSGPRPSCVVPPLLTRSRSPSESRATATPPASGRVLGAVRHKLGYAACMLLSSRSQKKKKKNPPGRQKTKKKKKTKKKRKKKNRRRKKKQKKKRPQPEERATEVLFSPSFLLFPSHPSLVASLISPVFSSLPLILLLLSSSRCSSGLGTSVVQRSCRSRWGWHRRAARPRRRTVMGGLLTASSCSHREGPTLGAWMAGENGVRRRRRAGRARRILRAALPNARRARRCRTARSGCARSHRAPAAVPCLGPSLVVCCFRVSRASRCFWRRSRFHVAHTRSGAAARGTPARRASASPGSRRTDHPGARDAGPAARVNLCALVIVALGRGVRRRPGLSRRDRGSAWSCSTPRSGPIHLQPDRDPRPRPRRAQPDQRDPTWVAYFSCGSLAPRKSPRSVASAAAGPRCAHGGAFAVLGMLPLHRPSDPLTNGVGPLREHERIQERDGPPPRSAGSCHA